MPHVSTSFKILFRLPGYRSFRRFLFCLWGLKWLCNSDNCDALASSDFHCDNKCVSAVGRQIIQIMETTDIGCCLTPWMRGYLKVYILLLAQKSSNKYLAAPLGHLKMSCSCKLHKIFCGLWPQMKLQWDSPLPMG